MSIDTTQVEIDFSSRGLARRSDPATSHIAALTVDANRLEKVVLSSLLEHRFGLTVKEIAAETGIDKWSISPRMSPLEKKGLIHRTEKRRDRSIVWRAR